MNTANTFLMHKATETAEYTKLLDITSYPDIFTAPPRLDATTLSHNVKVYEKDIADVPELTFGCLYDKEEMTTIKAQEDTNGFYALYFGAGATGEPDGHDGIFSWQGTCFFNPKGGSVGALRTAEITCYPSTEIEIA